jgi:flavin reductase (DIM6/NTAB) family NADH-FMN oxidoreductase RutF
MIGMKRVASVRHTSIFTFKSMSALTAGLGMSPNPSWKPGTPQPNPSDSKHVSVDPVTELSVYQLLISSVLPRPVALVSTVNSDGIGNLAPFSYFGLVSHDPPTLMLGVTNKPGGVKKDTINNIEQTGELVVNMVSEHMVEAASYCAGDFPPEVNEMDIAGLNPIPSELVKAPRVMESDVHYECKVISTQDMFNDRGQHTTTMVIARIVRIHILESILKGKGTGKNGGNNYRVDFSQYKPLGRLGGNTWAHLGATFDIERPKIDR